MGGKRKTVSEPLSEPSFGSEGEDHTGRTAKKSRKPLTDRTPSRKGDKTTTAHGSQQSLALPMSVFSSSLTTSAPFGIRPAHSIETGGDAMSSNSNLTPVIGMDCEMVGVGKDGTESVLARCSIVNANGDTLYDKYVQPQEDVTDFRTHVSGIRKQDLISSKAITFKQAQRDVAAIVKDRILVGHGLNNDLKVLLMHHPTWLVRDTTKYKPFCPHRPRKLKDLVKEKLNQTIQEGSHDSVDDARAVMLLYNTVKFEWEQAIVKRYGKTIKAHASAALVENKRRDTAALHERHRMEKEKKRVGLKMVKAVRSRDEDTSYTSEDDNESNDNPPNKINDYPRAPGNERTSDVRSKLSKGISLVGAKLQQGTVKAYAPPRMDMSVTQKLKKILESKKALFKQKKIQPNQSSIGPKR